MKLPPNVSMAQAIVPAAKFATRSYNLPGWFPSQSRTSWSISRLTARAMYYPFCLIIPPCGNCPDETISGVRLDARVQGIVVPTPASTGW